MACVGLNNNFTPRLGRTKGKLIRIPNGNTHRWWHDSKLSTQLSVIVLATVYCELSCNVDHICYLMQTQTFNNLRFQPMCRALRPVSNFDYNIQRCALAANLCTKDVWDLNDSIGAGWVQLWSLRVGYFSWIISALPWSLTLIVFFPFITSRNLYLVVKSQKLAGM